QEPVARLRDAGTGQLLHTLPHDKAVLTVAFSPDGKKVLTGGWDNYARLWDVSTGQPTGESFPHPARVVAAAFSPDGKTLVTAFAEQFTSPEPHKIRLCD